MDIIENVFHVLGGGDTIGTSCYYLQVDECAFLLDCGANIHQKPHLPALQDITNHYLDGIWQLDNVIISHGHFDHFGALPYLLNGEYNLSILCNPITNLLIKLQLNEMSKWQNIFHSKRQQQQYTLQKDRSLTMLKSWAFNQRYQGKNYAITLYPAGHIPGASMVYIETAKHRILYTGDFSKQNDLLCGTYNLPKNLPVDILIIEGTHAYGNFCPNNQQGYMNIADLVNENLAYNSVTLEVTNITKGIELARFLAKYFNDTMTTPPKIYLDEVMSPIVDTFEEANFQVYSEQIRPLIDDWQTDKAIFIKRKGKGKNFGTILNGDMFTLHASSSDLVNLINTIQATTTLIVHARPNGLACIMPMIDIGNKLCLQTKDNEAYRFK